MKRLFTLLLAISMVFSLAACGRRNPNAGVYNAVSCHALGLELDCAGDYLELKGNGKGTLCLMGEKYFCFWTLDGEDFTLKNHGDEFSGTLRNGVLTVNFSDMVYMYIMDAVEQKDGTVLGHVHQWKDADCEKGKTCVDCGETEGAALGHDALEANYQDASLCSRCGLEMAPALQADMEKYGFTEFMDVGVVYEYITVCLHNTKLETKGEVTVNSYEIFDSAEGYPAREGYEWRVVEMQALFYDMKARTNGVSTATNYESYYNIDLLDDSDVYDEGSDTTTFSVSWHGQIMDATSKIESDWSPWLYEGDRKQTIRTVKWAFCVPKGYDGMVIGFRNAAQEWEEGQHIYDLPKEDFLLFRLDNKDAAADSAETAYDQSGVAGTYSLYAMEDSGAYIDNATLVSQGLDGLVVITFNGDGTGVMRTEGEEMTFTYDDTKMVDAEGFTYEYVIEGGMLEIDLGDGQIFYCQKK